MKDKIVITIAREYGSGGRTIGEMLANKLGIHYYDKELTKVIIKYQTDEGVSLDNDKVLDLQIGSIYKIEPKEILADTNKLEWKLSESNKLSVKISRNPKENIYVISYEK